MVGSFRRKPFVLTVAVTSSDGLKKLLSGQYAAALLVDHWGGADGLALLRAARLGGCVTPVIGLTAEDSKEVDLAALEAGAENYR